MSFTITPTELQQRLQSDPTLQVLDVRTPVEYDEVHVTQARLESIDRLDPATLVRSGVVDPEKPIYLFCRSGGRATKAAEKLTHAGFKQAVVVEGGTLAWIKAGLPVTRGEAKVISLERQVRIAAGTLVLAGVILGFWVHPNFFLLSGFVGAGLIFAGITDWCGMGMLLAKLPWNNRRVE